MDRDSTEKAWEEIRQLIDELARMAKSDLSPPEFYTGLLDRVVAALAGVGGAVWVLEGQNSLQLQYQINLDQTGLAANDDHKQRHRQLLAWVLQRGESTFIPPHAGLSEEGPEVNPSDFLLLVAPMMVDEQVIGVVEIFKRPGGLPSARKGYLKFLNQMCGLAADYFKNHQLRGLKQRQAVWSEFENFTRLAHMSLDARETCYTLANEGRRFIDADRVTVATKRGSRCRVEAISGQDLLNRRSNVVRLLDRLITRVIRTEEPFWYTDETVNTPPQIEDVLHEYVDESHTRALAILPLRERPTRKEADDTEPGPDQKVGKVIGAIIVERFDNGRFDSGMRQRIEAVADHASLGLHNSLEHSRIFLLPLWKLLGKATWLFRFRTLPKTALAVAAIAAVVYVLGFVPWDFELEGKGKLQPQVTRDVFAPIDGDVIDVFAKHRLIFDEGKPLLQLRNDDLDLQIKELNDEVQVVQKKLDATKIKIAELRNDPDRQLDYLQAEVDSEEFSTRLGSLREQIEKLNDKKQKLTLRSPIRGMVTTWSVEQQLAGRPIQRGQVVLTLADLTQDWLLQVDMPEDRMGHVLAAHEEFLAEALGKLQDSKLLGDLEADPAMRAAVKTVMDDFPVEKLTDDGWFAEQKPFDQQQLEPLRNKLLAMTDDERAKAAEALNAGKLKVEFILATEPDQTYVGRVRSIAMTTEVKGEEGNTVRLTVDIDRSKLPTQLRPGAEVTAKVYCGEAAVGYVLFHDVWEFIQSKILFRIL